ncbi:signal peptidase I [Alkalihalobacillus xiaoxiensis]|uniref:Signal peptidase I n=1 Tax=Shouchella xiaoxiensis TaxID=766895 RepID=A0ABS2SQ39_9BACI|nr:signal peptidase I [Shouchella xiaoxiensis]MBM7837629.1 signal peptidase I [Shouchella xiaoxiensis]
MNVRKSPTTEWAKIISLALLITIAVRIFLLAPIIVEGHSMQPTLDTGDKMIVNQVGYTFLKPERFDIVVFHAPSGKDYIKRIVGLPGESLSYESDTLYIDGNPVDEPFLDKLKATLHGEQPLTGDFTLKELTGLDAIPEGHYFVMGDNRRLSKDSRDIGVVAKTEFIGKANLIFYPLDNMTIVNKK